MPMLVTGARVVPVAPAATVPTGVYGMWPALSERYIKRLRLSYMSGRDLLAEATLQSCMKESATSKKELPSPVRV
jgi:hypothetical protein